MKYKYEHWTYTHIYWNEWRVRGNQIRVYIQSVTYRGIYVIYDTLCTNIVSYLRSHVCVSVCCAVVHNRIAVVWCAPCFFSCIARYRLARVVVIYRKLSCWIYRVIVSCQNYPFESHKFFNTHTHTFYVYIPSGTKRVGVLFAFILYAPKECRTQIVDRTHVCNSNMRRAQIITNTLGIRFFKYFIDFF